MDKTKKFNPIQYHRYDEISALLKAKGSEIWIE